jgi:hypothetical protein
VHDPSRDVGTGKVSKEFVFSGSVVELQRGDLGTAACNLSGREPNAVTNHMDNASVCRGVDWDWTNAFQFDGAARTGLLETRSANLAKHFIIRRASRHGIPSPPLDTKAS